MNILDKDKVWLTRKFKPLADATTAYIQDDLFDDDDACDSGYCMI